MNSSRLRPRRAHTLNTASRAASSASLAETTRSSSTVAIVCGRTEGGSSVAFGHSVWVTEKRFDLVNARLLYLAPRRAVPLKSRVLPLEPLAAVPLEYRLLARFETIPSKPSSQALGAQALPGA
jgi:hypothetical protein